MTAPRAALLAVVLAAVLVQAFLHADHFVDDAYIGFHYAENLAAGNGFTWHPGDRPVEGVTNLGWVLVLAGLAGMGSLPAVAKAIGLVALLAAIGLASRLHRRFVPGASPVERAAVPLLLAAQPDLVYFALAGMETGLTALFATAAVLLALDLDERPRAGAVDLAGVALALFLLRPEMVLLVPTFVALRWLARDQRARRGLGLLLVLTLLGLAVVTAWRLSTFGQPLPNTFAAKSAGGFTAVAGRLLAAPAGGLVNLPPPFGLGLAVVAFGAWRLRRKGGGPGVDLALALTVTGVAFAVYARPDWTEMGRYFGPFVPVATVLFVHGAAGLAARVTPLRQRVLLAGVTLALIVHGVVRQVEHLGGAALEKLPGLALVSESLVEPARRVAALVPPGSTVACRRIGVLGYTVDARVFDFAFGLTEPEVAKVLARTGRPFFDNARTAPLGDIWRRVDPDYLLEDWTRLESWWTAEESPRRFHLHGVPYELIATFPIAQGHERWALARRIAGEPIVVEDDWRAGAERVGPRDPLRR